MRNAFALLLAFVSSASMADQFYVTVGVECNKAESEIVVSFHGAWNEAGERAIANLGRDSWDPRTLVSFTQDTKGKYSIQKKSETSTCLLGKHRYAIVISPELAPGFHPEGKCATRIGTMATVTLKNKVVSRGGVDACTEKGTVVTSITVRPHKAPNYQTVSAEVFYGT